MVECARRTARRMLETHLRHLILVTAALMAERTLDRTRIEEIIADADNGDDGDDEMLSTIVPDDASVMLRAIMPKDGAILHGPAEPLR